MTIAIVKTFFDEATNTATHIASDPNTNQASIFDPVLDYDPSAGRTHTGSADKILAYVRDEKLDVKYIIETHVHADHLSGAAYLKSKLYADIVIGAQIKAVQKNSDRFTVSNLNSQPMAVNLID